MKKIFCVVMILLAGLFQNCSPDQQMLPENHFKINEGERPFVIAHGGAKLLYPENTLLAFDSVVTMGVDMLEMDVRITRDSVLVCHHDATIDRMSDGTGKVLDYTYEELLQFNFGYGFQDLNGQFPYRDKFVPVAKLEDVLKTYPFMAFNIEIKDEGEYGKLAARKLKDLILAYLLPEQVIVASFHDDILDYFIEISDSKIPVSTSQKEATKMVLSGKLFAGGLYRPEAVAVQLPLKQAGLNLGTRRVIGSAHRHNMAIHYWTINDKEEMRNLIEKGADGIITDRPDIMKELLKEMGW